ncbi:MAG: hypothetical protein VYD05_15475 [Planctomycetota bacterium]|nr:hypothetical protein [Planctomycetota bacterium]
MSVVGDATPSGGDWDKPHADDREALARFPSEREWLDLPLPDELPRRDGADDEPFADRVLRARAEEQELDHELDGLGRALPDDLLAHFGAPRPSATFAARTALLVEQARRQRWAEILARYVAPEPSPQLIDRTLTALRGDRAPLTRRSAGGTPASGRAPIWGLLAAGAAAVLWAALVDRSPPPLEARLADQAPEAAAYRGASTPMAAVFADLARDEEPHALFDAPVDGLWLYRQPEEPR